MILKDKKLLITGVANHRSIAWNIAKACKEAGAKIAFTYLERAEESVRKLVEEEMPDSFLIKMNAVDDDEVKEACEKIDKAFDGQGLDGLVHSIAFAKKDDIAGDFYTIERKNFEIAMSTSVYTLISLSRHCKPLLEKNEGGSIITMSYIGSEKVIPNYNIMGVAKSALESSVRYLAYDLGKSNIRVNAISAGAIPTVSARVIEDFSSLYDKVSKLAPLRRNVDVEEVANTAVFLLSNMSNGITGETMHVDAGHNIMGAV